MEVSMKQAINNPELYTHELNEFYLSWFNESISIETFAEYHGVTIETADKAIELGRAVNWDSNLRGSVS